MSAGAGAPRTVMFVQQYGDGGSMTSLLDLVRGLDPARYRAVVVFRTENPFVAEMEAAGAEVICMAEGSTEAATPSPTLGRRTADGSRSGSLRREVRRWYRRDLPAYRRLRAITREVRPDLIHGNNDVRINRDAVLVSFRLRIPIVVHMRWIYDVPEGDVSVRTDRLLARHPARYFFISEAASEAYSRRLAIPGPKRVVVDNPFAVDDYVASPSADLARELGIEGRGPVVLHVGRLTPWKGQDVLVRALPALLEVVPDAVVVLLGQATEGKHEHFPDELRALVAELGLSDHVIFAGARRDVPAVLALSDVVVHCSITPEPFGRVIVEAMAASRPVVAADAGGVPEIIDAGATGLLVPPADPAALAAALVQLLADPIAAAEMGARGRRSAEERFSIEAHARVVQATYDEVLGPP